MTHDCSGSLFCCWVCGKEIILQICFATFSFCVDSATTFFVGYDNMSNKQEDVNLCFSCGVNSCRVCVQIGLGVLQILYMNYELQSYSPLNVRITCFFINAKLILVSTFDLWTTGTSCVLHIVLICTSCVCILYLWLQEQVDVLHTKWSCHLKLDRRTIL